MPKHPAEDVPHALMTDHLIQRAKPAARHATEAGYRGEVVPYYPAAFSKPVDELYLLLRR